MSNPVSKEPKVANVPNLRFAYSEDIAPRNLSFFLEVRSERNTKGLFDKNDVLSVSGDSGIVNQIELLGRSYAGESVLLYHVVEVNDIVYTKSPLASNPYGIIKTNGYKAGIVSTLYAVYKAKTNCNPFFVQHYFDYKPRINKYLRPIVRIGAKHDMKIGNQEVLENTVFFPSVQEQNEIVSFLELVNERIETQNKIIGDLLALKNFLINRHFSKPSNRRMDQYIVWESERNRSLAVTDVYSVSNSRGFVLQTEQFEDRAIASGDVSNYKLVRNGFFAFNPARVNVGSIAYYSRKDPGIVSPMYNCFSVNGLEPDYLLAFFQSKQFKRRLQNKLEGSVRSCLTPDGMNHIQFFVAPKKERAILEKVLFAFERKISIERTILTAFQKQKAYLLANMFI